MCPGDWNQQGPSSSVCQWLVLSQAVCWYFILSFFCCCVTDRAATDPTAEMLLLHLHSLESSSLPTECSFLLGRNLWIFPFKTKSFKIQNLHVVIQSESIANGLCVRRKQPQGCARGRWGFQEALGICHGTVCCHEKFCWVPHPGEQPLPSRQPVRGFPQRVEFGTAALGSSTYNTLRDVSAPQQQLWESEVYLFIFIYFFIRLQVGLMIVKVYSRLGGFFFSTQLFTAVRAVSCCVYSLGGKSRK